MHKLSKTPATVARICGLPLSLLAALTLATTGCEDKDDNKVAKAQQCLDKASPGGADACAQIVAGLERPAAYLIRCSAVYIDQGFTTSRISDVYDYIKNSGTTDSTNTAIAALAFGGATPAAITTDVNKVVEYCEKSGVNSLKRLASMTRLASLPFTLGLPGIALPDPTQPIDPNSTVVSDFKQALADISTLSAAEQTAAYENLGASVVSAQENYCAPGSSFKEKEICTQLDTAVTNAGGTSNLEDIGKALRCELLKANPPADC